MRHAILRRLPWMILLGGTVLVLGCWQRSSNPKPSNSDQESPQASADTIPPDQFEAVLTAHFEGVGAMEQYRYADAAAAFHKVRAKAPGWTPGKINLALALLNDVGVKSEETKKQGGEVSKDNFAEALELLDGVLARDPEHLSARYCRGVILQYLGDIAAAHPDFQGVVDRDPSDGHAWLRLAMTLPDPDRPGFKAERRQAAQLMELYENALKRNPYLVPAYYNLMLVTGWAAADAPTPEARQAFQRKQRDLLATFNQMNPQENPAGTGERGGNVYGEMGRYARLLGPELPRSPGASIPPPRFDEPAPLQVTLAPGERWARSADYAGVYALHGRAFDRFGLPVAAFDADGDGRLDLFLGSAIMGADGLRDALLLNRGEGRFEDVSTAYGLPANRASLGVAAGDFDADRFLDLYLTGPGENRLLRNLGGKRFEDVTAAAGVALPGMLSLTARWLDLDQDGDLDLYVINYTQREHADAAFRDGPTPPGVANLAFRNDGRPPTRGMTPEKNLTPVATATDEQPGEAGLSLAFTPWPDGEELQGGDAPHTGLAALDIDDDRDIDLILTADSAPPTVLLNGRLGRFTAVQPPGLDLPATASGLLVSDLDRDGRPDLVAIDARGPIAARRNRTIRGPDGRVAFAFEAWPIEATHWRAALAADLDLDGAADLVGARSGQGLVPSQTPASLIEWARPQGGKAVPLEVPGRTPTGSRGLAVLDLTGDPLPDLLFVDDRGPCLARNLGNGLHWLALDLSGRWKFSFDQMRTNPHGLGARLALEGQGLYVPFDHTTNASGLGQSVAPFVLGMGTRASAALLHLTWPDGVMQAELNVPADQRLILAEYNRKTGSCPVLFTWNGRRFTCIGDFLGGGGLGYLIAPGVYGDPDRDEAVLIGPDQLRPEGGLYQLRILEPMDEIAYLDRLTLDVVDTPPGLSAAPDERFAPGGNRPSGDLLAWSEAIRPQRATDLDGRDVMAALREFDRVTVDQFPRYKGWIGYAEEHGIVLDFTDQLARFGPTDRLVLALAGWVEYPYSQTNYAAATAGVPLQPPVLERLRDDGTWEVIEADPGYPAGLPRLTTLELTGKLTGPRCVLRLRTNMECYYDQAFIAVLKPNAEVRSRTLTVQRATLGRRGYVREVSPDGRLPLLYDYDAIDPAPLARFRGKLTRHGDVRELLLDDDDQLCLVGPGDELALEFDARDVPALPEGWTRRFVLRTVGYCKDADPFTAASDDVGPLPWKGMPAYPFGPEGDRPVDVSYQEYLQKFQNRPAGISDRD